MLFKPPKRKETDIKDIIKKANSTVEDRKNIKISGTSLLDKIAGISKVVEQSLGNLKENYLLITKEEEWLEYCRQTVKDELAAIDTECAGLELDEMGKLAGVCIKSLNQKAAYVPVGHISNITESLLPHQISIGAITEGLQMLKDNNTKLIFHNGYFDLVVIKLSTDIWLDVYWDTLPASFLLNENESHNLKYLYNKYVMNGEVGVHKFNELFAGIPFCYIPPKVGYVYGAFDAEQTLALFEFQKPYLTIGTEECRECKLEGVIQVYQTEELPIIPVLAEMKYRGIQIDLDIAKNLHDKYTKLKNKAEVDFLNSIEKYKDDILFRMNTFGDIEYPINFNSPNQMKILIYDIMGSKPIFSKEPTGTGKHVIETVLNTEKYKNTDLYNVISALSEVKKYDKALSSFIDNIAGIAVKYGGRIHGNFNSCSARTGRLSSSGINYQQIPSKLGDIRNMFTAGKGRVFISADIKKQEVVVASIISGDVKLQEALRSGLDVYSQIASVAYKNKYEDNLEFFPDGTTNKDGKKRRSACKAVVLGCLYSKGVRSISEDLHISIEDAQEVYDAVMNAFPQLANWISETQAKANLNGYVEGMFGRRRRLPDLQLPPYEFTYTIDIDERTKVYYNDLYTGKLNKIFKQEGKQKIITEALERGIDIKQNGGFIAKAQRECVNSIVQGSSADICKRIIIAIGNSRRLAELGCKLELSIHDEQIVSCPKEHAWEICEILRRITEESTGNTPVKLEIDTAITDVWYGDEYKFNEKHELELEG